MPRHLTSSLAHRIRRLIDFLRVRASLIATLNSVTGADPSGPPNARSGAAITNAAPRQPFPAARFILEPGDGDGRCDKTTVFADGLMIPTGIELGNGGAYVGQGTELLHLKDTNGDDKADERRVVLRGFGTGDNHQNINSFLFDPGGELWFSQGLHIRSHVETPWASCGSNRQESGGFSRAGSSSSVLLSQEPTRHSRCFFNAARENTAGGRNADRTR